MFQDFQEPKLKNKRSVIKKLQPFWKRYLEKESKLRMEVVELEKEMNESMGLGMELQFFYVDGECVGIGASEFKDRNTFPLIHDSELDSDR